MLHRPLAALVAVLLALALVRVRRGRRRPRPPPRKPRPRLPSETTAAPPAFPVTVEGDNGSLTLEEEPDAIVSLSPTATESLFAIGAGDQVIAVDDQSNYPAEAPMTNLSGLHAERRGDRRLQARSRRRLVRPGRARRRRSRSSRSRCSSRSRGRRSHDAYDQIEPARRRPPGTPAEAASVVATMKAQIAASIASAPTGAQALKVYHELGPDYYSATSKTFIGSVYALLGLKNIADAADKTRLRLPAALRRVHRHADPDLIVLADTKCCGQTAATSRSGRAGARSPRSRTATSSRSTTTSPLAGGRGSSTSSSIVAAKVDTGGVEARRRQFAARGRGGASRPVRPRGVPIVGAAAFLVGSTLLGLLVGPVHLGIGAVVAARPDRTCRSWTSDSPMSRARTRRSSGSSARRASCSGCSSAAMLALAGGVLPGRVPEPARRPVPARRRRRRRARSDVRDRLRPRRRARARPACPLRRSSAPRSAWRSLRCSAASRGGGRSDGRARPRRRDGRRLPHRACRPSSSSSTPRRCRRSTAGSSAGSTRRAGTTSRSCAVRRRQRGRPPARTGACSTCSASATRRRRASACNVGRVRLLVVVAATIGTAAAVAFSGLIAFVGIIVPHAIRPHRRHELPDRAAALAALRRAGSSCSATCSRGR